MAENKKQHFVPQFYLRNFAHDDKRIWVYNLKSKKSYLSLIRTSCQEKYFYGKDGQLEKIFATLEKKFAETLKKIITEATIENLTVHNGFYLRIFLLLQYMRTKDSKENIFDKITDFYVDTAIKPKMKMSPDYLKEKGITDECIDSLKISNSSPQISGILAALCGAELLRDLRPILLVNKSETNLITGDAPVAKNNYLTLKNDSLTGFQSPGLQIFFPLNPRLALLLVDDAAYLVSANDEGIVEIEDSDDIEQINLLHILNSQEKVFFSEEKDEADIERLCKDADLIRKTKGLKITPIKKISSSDGESREILRMHMEGVNYQIKFSFIKLNHQYNRIFKGKTKRLLKTHEFVQPLRNKELADRASARFHKACDNAKTQSD